MGIPMEDIHSATTSTAANGSNIRAEGSATSSREGILELMKQKDYLEAELTALGQVLDSVKLQASIELKLVLLSFYKWTASLTLL
jgi:hypothetical protein